MKVIQFSSSLYGIVSAYNRGVINASKLIPGMTWDKTRNAWTGTRDAVDRTCKILSENGVPVAPLVVVDAWNGGFRTRAAQHFPKKLRQYQYDGGIFIIDEKRAILAFDMGLGKTLTALSAALAVGKRVLIVCPSKGRDVWRQELKKSFNAEAYFCEGRSPRSLAVQTRIVVCHYDILSAWSSLLALFAFDVVIFDEAQNLMNETSARTKAARKVSERATYVWGLTGTPIPNHVADLYSIVETIRPGTFGDKFFNFGRRYCAGHQEEHPSRTIPGAKEKHWVFGPCKDCGKDGTSNLDELRERLSYFLLRKTKSDVALELPAMTRQSIFLDVPNVTGLLPSAETLRNRKETRRLLDLSANAKFRYIEDAAFDAVQDGAKVVIFTYRKAVAESVVANLIVRGVTRATCFHGDKSQAVRKTILDDAARGEVDVLVATIDSAGDAINLSFASVCIFAELSYEPYKLLQAEARLHRFEQKNPVLVQYYLARGTIDELIAANVIAKLETMPALELTPDGALLQTSLQESDDALLSNLYASMLGADVDADVAPIVVEDYADMSTVEEFDA